MYLREGQQEGQSLDFRILSYCNPFKVGEEALYGGRPPAVPTWVSLR